MGVALALLRVVGVLLLVASYLYQRFGRSMLGDGGSPGNVTPEAQS